MLVGEEVTFFFLPPEAGTEEVRLSIPDDSVSLTGFTSHSYYSVKRLRYLPLPLNTEKKESPNERGLERLEGDVVVIRD